MIKRIKKNESYNPIREHLDVVPQSVPTDARLNQIVEYLLQNKFDPRISKAVIFCRTRRTTEDLAEVFNEHPQISTSSRLRNNAKAFHAGMSGEERNDAYEAFLGNETSVLFSTKAFGMGMDIPNIHFLFHYDPPSSLEDYLQEVGRAGRDRTMLAKAGFSNDQPIKCLIFATSEDFSSARDRIHKSSLTWKELQDIFKLTLDIANQFASSDNIAGKNFPLPLTFCSNNPDFRGVQGIANKQRLGLHWLETSGRIEILSIIPAHLFFPNNPVNVSAASADVKPLVQFLSAIQTKTGKDAKAYHASISDLSKTVGTDSFTELFKLLSVAHRQCGLKLDHSVNIELSKKRMKEVDFIVEKSARSPILDCYYELVIEIAKRLRIGETHTFDSSILNDIAAHVALPQLVPDKFAWIDEPKRDSAAKKELELLKKLKKTRLLFKILRSTPKIYFKMSIEKKDIKYIVRSGSKASLEWLQRSYVFAYKLLAKVNEANKQNEPIQLLSLLTEFKESEDDLDFLEMTLQFLKGLGYLSFSSPLVPLAMDVKVKSTEPFNIENTKGKDYRIWKDFNDHRRLREYRLAALEAFFNTHERDSQRKFIEDYFQSEKPEDIFSNIESILGGDHPLVKALRSEELNRLVDGEVDPDGKRKGGLSEEQMQVYKSPFESSVLVVAGPGSGKTHTLLLRVARLIYEGGTNPSQILILAYNRAVVMEIKHRLHDLFSKLGYRHLVGSLHVYTFHAMIQRIIPEQIKDAPFDEWANILARELSANPGLIQSRLGNIDFVFVDEFQDITQQRYSLLKLIANPKRVAVTAIGDPNQSIYGYEREKDGSIGSESFFTQFLDEYGATQFTLLNNYRSYELIIRQAESVISKVNNRMLASQLKAIRETPKDLLPVVVAEATEGTKGIAAFLGDMQSNNRTPHDVALLFRTNDELYRALSDLRKQLDPSKWAVRIQGDSGQFSETREASSIIEIWKGKGLEKIPSNYRSTLLEAILKTKQKKKNWNQDNLDLLAAVVLEFLETAPSDATFEHLVDYVVETARSRDGQLYKLFQMRREEINKDRKASEVVFSTIHKVKGLEFDTVIIPPSVASLPFGAKSSKAPLDQWIDEELRIRFVAMTRARNNLTLLSGEREKRLMARQQYEMPSALKTKLGVPCSDGMEQIFMSYAAKKENLKALGFADEEAYTKYLENDVKSGDPLTLEKRNTDWLIKHSGQYIGRLSKSLGERLLKAGATAYSGVLVTDIFRHNYTDVLRSDERNETTFAKLWSDESKKRGFVYVVGLGGYATKAP